MKTNRRSRHDPFINIEAGPRNIDRWIIRSSIRDRLREVYPHLKGKLLDVGCGKMPYRKEIMVSTKVSSYIGLDIETALVYDEKVKPDLTWDGQTMPVQSESIDSVIATEVVEHVYDMDSFLSEVKRVLRPGGVFFLTTPFVWPYHEAPHDMQRWTAFGLDYHLKKAGFSSVSVTSVGNWYSTLAQMLGLWGARAPMNRVVRKLFRWPIYILQKILCRFDNDSPPGEASMPRMCTVIARV